MEVEKVSEIKKRLTITMSSNMYSELENLAKEMGLSKSALLTVAFEEFKQKRKGKKIHKKERPFGIGTLFIGNFVYFFCVW